jgi:shikimate kinase
MSNRRTFLIGMPGSGKSTVGKLLAKMRNVSFLDLDDRIEQQCGMAISEIFASQGEEYFRKKEAEILRLTIARSHAGVIACGGGTPCFYHNIELINSTGLSVYIEVGPEQIAARLEAEGKDVRPLLQDHSGPGLVKFLSEKLKIRALYYEKARIIVSASGVNPERVAEQIHQKL